VQRQQQHHPEAVKARSFVTVHTPKRSDGAAGTGRASNGITSAGSMNENGQLM